jgi:hypothetical protein
MKFNRLGSLLLFLTVGIVFAADYFNLPRLNLMVVIGLGLFASISGIRIVLNGETTTGRTNISNPNYIERYSGLSARLFGAILVVSGLMIIGLGTLELFRPGGAGAFIDRLVSSSFGLASVVGLAGLMTAAFGVIRILSGSATSPGTHGKLVEFSIKAGGVVTALVGLGLLFLAVWAAIAPGWLQDVARQIVSYFQNLILK